MLRHGATITEAEADLPVSDVNRAVMVVVPGENAVTRPVFVTVAIAVLDENHCSWLDCAPAFVES
jgi:hypothetical protein